MNLITTAKLPKKNSVEVNNQALTEGMRGASLLKRGLGLQIAPTKVLANEW